MSPINNSDLDNLCDVASRLVAGGPMKEDTLDTRYNIGGQYPLSQSNYVALPLNF